MVSCVFAILNCAKLAGVILLVSQSLEILHRLSVYRATSMCVQQPFPRYWHSWCCNGLSPWVLSVCFRWFRNDRVLFNQFPRNLGDSVHIWLCHLTFSICQVFLFLRWQEHFSVGVGLGLRCVHFRPTNCTAFSLVLWLLVHDFSKNQPCLFSMEFRLKK